MKKKYLEPSCKSVVLKDYLLWGVGGSVEEGDGGFAKEGMAGDTEDVDDNSRTKFSVWDD